LIFATTKSICSMKGTCPQLGTTTNWELGFLRYAIQLYLTAVALNLKRMVKLLTGVNFKGRARATA